MVAGQTNSTAPEHRELHAVWSNLCAHERCTRQREDWCPVATLLLIDDDDDFRTGLKRILQEAGHTVLEASDGIAAVEIFRHDRPDVVITDIIMPNKDGMETIMEVRREDPAAKIIAISGGPHMIPDYYLDAARVFGAIRTIAKPFKSDVLLQAIDELLAAPATPPK